MLVKAKFDFHPELPNRKPNGLFSCTDSSIIKMAILNHANRLPLNYKWKICYLELQ